MAAVMKTWGAASGLLAGAVALGVAELTAALTGPLGAPVTAVGEAAINLTPVPVKEFAIAHFGTHDKQALVAGILVLLAGFAAAIGVLAARRLGCGLAGLAVFAAVGVTAAISRPGAGAADVVPTLAGTAVAAVTLMLLMRATREPAGGPQAVTDGTAITDGTAVTGGTAVTAAPWSRTPRRSQMARRSRTRWSRGPGGDWFWRERARRSWRRGRAVWAACCSDVRAWRRGGCACRRRGCGPRAWEQALICGYPG
jgi:hypothetical protein